MFAADAVKNRLEVFAPLPGRIEEGTSRRRCIGAAALVLPSIGPVGAVTPGGARVLPDSLTGNRTRKALRNLLVTYGNFSDLILVTIIFS